MAAGKLWGKGKRRGQPKVIAPTSALWLSLTGRRLSYQMIADRIRDYALINRISQYYKKLVTTADLKQPLWKLIRQLNK